MAMTALIERDILVLDGGLGTTLEDEYGVEFSSTTPLWSSHLLISDAATLRHIQGRFAKAGADILLTPTYQASHEGFARSGVRESSEYFKSAVQISRQATSGLVALSLGAYGATLQPSQEYSGNYGAYTRLDLMEFHAERLKAFDECWGDIDIVAFETIPRLDEIRAVKDAYNQNKPYWISCVFPENSTLPDGTTIADLLHVALDSPRPWAIGLNCTKVHKVGDLIKQFEKAAIEERLVLPRLVVYPDGTNGQTYDTVSQKWVGDDVEGADWSQQVVEIVSAVHKRGRWKGIVVGGCCKTSPHQIAQLRVKIDRLLARIDNSHNLSSEV